MINFDRRIFIFRKESILRKNEPLKMVVGEDIEVFIKEGRF